MRKPFFSIMIIFALVLSVVFTQPSFMITAKAEPIYQLVESIDFSDENDGRISIRIPTPELVDATFTEEGLVLRKIGTTKAETSSVIVELDNPIAGGGNYFIKYTYINNLSNGSSRLSIGPYNETSERVSEGVVYDRGSGVNASVYVSDTGTSYGSTTLRYESLKNEETSAGFLIQPSARAIDSIFINDELVESNRYYFRSAGFSTLTHAQVNFYNQTANNTNFIIKSLEIYEINQDAFYADIESLSYSEITKTMPEKLTLPNTLANGASVEWVIEDDTVISEDGSIDYPDEGYEIVNIKAVCSAFNGILNEEKVFAIPVMSNNLMFVWDYKAMDSDAANYWSIVNSNGGYIGLDKNKMSMVRTSETSQLITRYYFMKHNSNDIATVTGENVVANIVMSAKNINQSNNVLFDPNGKIITSWSFDKTKGLSVKYSPVDDTERNSDSSEEMTVPYTNGDIINLRVITNTDTNEIRVLVNNENVFNDTVYSVENIKGVGYVEFSGDSVLDDSNNEVAIYNLMLLSKWLDENQANTEILMNDYENLSFSVISDEAQSAVNNNLNLITKGDFGSNITWESNYPEIINPETGEVTRGDDVTTVILTAVFEVDGETQRKEFEITVMRGVTEGNIALNRPVLSNAQSTASNAPSKVNDGIFETEWKNFDQIDNPYIEIDLESVERISTVLLYGVPFNGEYTIKDAVIETSTDKINWNVEANTGSIGERAKVTFRPVKARYVRMRVTEKSENKNVGLYEFEIIYAPEDNLVVKADIKELMVSDDYIITGDISLPETGEFGSSISWATSDESIFSRNGQYSAPSTDTVIKITATVSKGSYSETAEFTHLIKGSSSGNVPPRSSSPSRGSGGASGPGQLVNVIGNGQEEDDNEEDNQDKIFDDVNENDWSYEYIVKLAERNIISGDGSGMFYPRNQVTREEFLKMILEALEIPVESVVENNFNDVEQGSWYEEYVNTATKLGIIKGVNQNEFGVGLNISREDMAVIAAKSLSAVDKTFEEKEEISLNDEEKISDYAKESIIELINIGVISGDENANFNPQDTATREEAVKVIYLISQ